jgi:quinol monooxygenase YgiN
MIGLIAKLKVQEGKGPQFEAAFRQLAALVTDDAVEPGNLLYQLCKSREDPNTYVVMELYKDQAAVEAHSKTKHFTEIFPKIGEFLQPGPPGLEFVDAVD